MVAAGVSAARRQKRTAERRLVGNMAVLVTVRILEIRVGNTRRVLGDRGW